MEEYTKIRCRIPKDFDYKLNQYINKLKKRNIKPLTKADLIIKFAQIGYLQEAIR